MTPSTFKAPVTEEGETLTEQDGIEAATLILSVAGKLGLAQPFKDSTLTAAEQRALLHAVSEAVAADLKESAESVVAEIAPAPVKGLGSAVSKFFGKAKKVIRTAALAAAMIFTGPTFAEMPADVQTAVITQVARQDAYLADFEQEVRSGEQKPGGIVNRAGMYGQATWAIGLQVVATMARTNKMVKERNVLGDDNPESPTHCEECPQLTELGWVEIGSLPPIGDRECTVRCHCYLEYMDAAGKVYEVFA